MLDIFLLQIVLVFFNDPPRDTEAIRLWSLSAGDGACDERIITSRHCHTVCPAARLLSQSVTGLLAATCRSHASRRDLSQCPLTARCPWLVIYSPTGHLQPSTGHLASSTQQ